MSRHWGDFLLHLLSVPGKQPPHSYHLLVFHLKPWDQPYVPKGHSPFLGYHISPVICVLSWSESPNGATNRTCGAPSTDIPSNRGRTIGIFSTAGKHSNCFTPRVFSQDGAKYARSRVQFITSIEPFPPKLVERIEAGQFVVLWNLLTDNISLIQQVEALNG